MIVIPLQTCTIPVTRGYLVKTFNILGLPLLTSGVPNGRLNNFALVTCLFKILKSRHAILHVEIPDICTKVNLNKCSTIVNTADFSLHSSSPILM